MEEGRNSGEEQGDASTGTGSPGVSSSHPRPTAFSVTVDPSSSSPSSSSSSAIKFVDWTVASLGDVRKSGPVMLKLMNYTMKDIYNTCNPSKQIWSSYNYTCYWLLHKFIFHISQNKPYVECHKHVADIVCACIFLAGKTDFLFIKVDSIISICKKVSIPYLRENQKLVHGKSQLQDPNIGFPDRADIFLTEMDLLYMLSFDLRSVGNPFRAVEKIEIIMHQSTNHRKAFKITDKMYAEAIYQLQSSLFLWSPAISQYSDDVIAGVAVIVASSLRWKTSALSASSSTPKNLRMQQQSNTSSDKNRTTEMSLLRTPSSLKASPATPYCRSTSSSKTPSSKNGSSLKRISSADESSERRKAGIDAALQNICELRDYLYHIIKTLDECLPREGCSVEYKLSKDKGFKRYGRLTKERLDRNFEVVDEESGVEVVVHGVSKIRRRPPPSSSLSSVAAAPSSSLSSASVTTDDIAPLPPSSLSSPTPKTATATAAAAAAAASPPRRHKFIRQLQDISHKLQKQAESYNKSVKGIFAEIVYVCSNYSDYKACYTPSNQDDSSYEKNVDHEDNSEKYSESAVKRMDIVDNRGIYSDVILEDGEIHDNDNLHLDTWEWDPYAPSSSEQMDKSSSMPPVNKKQSPFLNSSKNRNQIFVYNLDARTTGTMLEEYFSRFGVLLDVSKISNKSYGFVTFRDVESYNKTIEKNFHVIDRSDNVKVEKAYSESLGPNVSHGSSNYGREVFYDKQTRPRSSLDSKSQYHPRQNRSRKIFVGNLPTNANRNMMMEYFARFGTITDCNIIRGRCFGFVTFEDHLCVDDVLNCNYHALDGMILNVQESNLPVDAGAGNQEETMIKSRKMARHVSYENTADVVARQQQSSSGSSFAALNLDESRYGARNLRRDEDKKRDRENDRDRGHDVPWICSFCSYKNEPFHKKFCYDCHRDRPVCRTDSRGFRSSGERGKDNFGDMKQGHKDRNDSYRDNWEGVEGNDFTLENESKPKRSRMNENSPSHAHDTLRGNEKSSSHSENFSPKHGDAYSRSDKKSIRSNQSDSHNVLRRKLKQFIDHEKKR